MNAYVSKDTLVIPFDSDSKFWWWAGGQSITETLKELNKERLIKEYKTSLKGMTLGPPAPINIAD